MRLLTLLLAMAACLSLQAQTDSKQTAQRKYDIFVAPYTNEDVVQSTNDSIHRMQKRGFSQDGNARSIGEALKLNFGNSLLTRFVNTTTSLANLLIDAAKGDREEWLQTAQQQCRISKELPGASTVSDFYALPSTKGALDPENIRFRGFGCRSYLECTGCSRCANNQDSTRLCGANVFYLWCSLRTDSSGIAAMVNHSKFLVQVDSFAFNPYKCELPNDSCTVDSLRIPFSFETRKDLTFSLGVRIFSSWINEAILLTQDQQLGEFTITAQIEENQLDESGFFTYSARNPADSIKKVSIAGDCFLVPRSYTGTLDTKTQQTAWGTGEFRIEMTLSESCQVNERYYHVTTEALPTDGSQPEQQQEQDTKQDEKKWDKDKWKPEWKKMQRGQKNKFWSQAVAAVQANIIGSNWVTTITDPLLTAISDTETEWIQKTLDIEEQSTMP